jgi:hypothetical protein
MKLFLAVGILFLAALPASAQSASVFIKGDDAHCWQDVAEVVHTHAREVEENDDLHILRVGHFSRPAGDLFLTVQALTEKDKKGAEGCRIYVEVEGGASLGVKSQVVNDLSDNTRVANIIGAEVAAMQKARDKQPKKAANQ